MREKEHEDEKRGIAFEKNNDDCSVITGKDRQEGRGKKEK